MSNHYQLFPNFHSLIIYCQFQHLQKITISIGQLMCSFRYIIGKCMYILAYVTKNIFFQILKSDNHWPQTLRNCIISNLVYSFISRKFICATFGIAIKYRSAPRNQKQQIIYHFTEWILKSNTTKTI